ncbi:MAG: MMPL family transporter [Pseudomonadota bacterium]|nr:MMPL family transporter [Pseudomonadota bacterium]
MIQKIEKFLVEKILRNWKGLSLFSLVFVALCSWGFKNLKFDTDYRSFLSYEEQARLRDFDNTYTKDKSLFLAVSAREGDLFSPQNLAALEWLTEASWQIPYTKRVDSLTNFQNMTVSGDELVVQDLVKNALGMSPSKIKEAKAIALSDPRVVKRILSLSAQHTIIVVSFSFDDIERDKVATSMEAVDKLILEAKRKFPGLDYRPTGGVMMSYVLPQIALRDIMISFPIMNLILFALLWYFFKSIKGVALTGIVISASILSTFGIYGWLGSAISTNSAMAPTIILTLAVADTVHFFLGFQRMYLKGLSKVEAVKKSLEFNLMPMFLTTLTTYIGFLSLNFSDSPNYVQFGNIVATGVALAFFFTIVLVPGIILFWPSSDWGRPANVKYDIIHNLLRRTGVFVVENKKLSFFGSLTLVIFLIASIPKNKVDDDFLKSIDESHQVRRDYEFVSQNIVGFQNIDFNFKTGIPDKIKDPEYLLFLDRFSNWLMTQSEVKSVVSVNDIFKRLNQVLNNNKKSFYKIPDNGKLAAQYLLLYEISLPQGLDLTNMINIDKSASRMVVLLQNMSNVGLVAFAKKAEDWLKQNAPSFIIETKPVGGSLSFAKVTMDNISSMIEGEIVTTIIISLLMIVFFRPAIVGLIAIIPNFLPGLCGLGLWAWIYGEVGMAVASVFGITLGIAIDDTIHFVTHYIDARKEKNVSSEEAVLHCFEAVGPAMLATTLVLVCGFGALYFSQLKMNSQFGILTAWIFALAVLGDFFLLGPMLMLFDKRK